MGGSSGGCAVVWGMAGEQSYERERELFIFFPTRALPAKIKGQGHTTVWVIELAFEIYVSSAEK